MRQFLLKLFCIFLFTGVCASAHGQQISIAQKLSGLPGITAKQLSNTNFNQYFEIFIEQPLDHFNPKSKKFQQRVYLGINSIDSVTVMDTDGYGIDYATNPDYKYELATLLNANLVVIEHRYFGRSVPDSLDYSDLTLQQASADDHHIKLVLQSILKSKWLSTGISKGGQAALAYRMYYPGDVSATVLYGTAVKKLLNENKIDSMLNVLAQTPCGKALEAFQLAAFKQKAQFISLLKEYTLKAEPLILTQFELETYLDYMLLELPFSFWQQRNSCTAIPPAFADAKTNFDYLVSVIPPRFYSKKNMDRLQPAFYMSYHELGYYEYNTQKFKPYLKQGNYSNKNFAPQNIRIDFDPAYLNALNKFLQTPVSQSIVFIYGQSDPWSAMQHTYGAKKIIVPNGSHKSRINDLDHVEKEKTIRYLRALYK